MEIPLVDLMIDVHGMTDIGRVRQLNEDSIAIVSSDEPATKKKGTLLIVADGLGGHNAGELASQLVTSEVPQMYFDGGSDNPLTDLVKAITKTNKRVHGLSTTSELMQGMGTTVVVVAIVDQFAVFANVGDSRGYLLRKGSIIHRTKDHSLKDTSIDLPGYSSANRFSHVLTRAIGPKPDVMIDVTAHRLAVGDIILLCSDGLSDSVSDEEMKSAVYQHPPHEAAKTLIDLANERGGEDNTSVIVALINELPTLDTVHGHLHGIERYLIP